MKKSVLITGCSSGIGAAAAKVFSDHGWNVAATMRSPEQGEALRALPGVKVLALNVTDKASIGAAVRQTLQDFGSIDALVNNAGYGLFGPFETASQEVIKRQFDTNLFGLFDVTRAVLPSMREHQTGVIVNVASIGGLTTFPMNSLYHATKYAVVGFSESLGYELAPFGIQVKVIAPGGVATDFAGRSMVRTFEGDGGAYAPTIAKVMAAFAAAIAVAKAWVRRFTTPSPMARRRPVMWSARTRLVWLPCASRQAMRCLPWNCASVSGWIRPDTHNRRG